MLVGSGGIGSPSKSPLVRCRRMPSRKTEPRAFFRRATSFDAEAVVTSIVVVSPSSTGTTVVAAASAAADNSRAAAARSVGSALNLFGVRSAALQSNLHTDFRFWKPTPTPAPT